ncbi:MAG: heme biosynthesis HemY N-terminal domain-containing protein [Pseudoxanthomonas suwonensis]|nr:heme biosynthesis HemY N-terminal domain-containing protein [Pseudoxanthomonas suwonensis]
MRTVLFWIVLALVGALAAQFLMSDPGYVLVRYAGTDYTTTVAYALAGILGGLLLLWLLWLALTTPLRAWRERQAGKRQARTGEGLDALELGEYERAEKLLAQAAADNPEAAAGLRIAAARAARHRGDLDAAHRHINALDADHATARAIANAHYALREERPTDALVALDAPQAQPLPPRGLALRAKALAATGQAAAAYGLLGSLRKQHALPEAELDALQLQWAEDQLRQATDRNALAERWEAMPKTLRHEPAVAAAYARRASDEGWHDAAEQAIRQALEERWDEELAHHYAALPGVESDERLRLFEGWRKRWPASPAAASALATSLRRRGEWPAARDHLQAALDAGGSARIWEQLGDGHAEAGDEQRARLCYGNALRAARGEPVMMLPPEGAATTHGAQTHVVPEHVATEHEASERITAGQLPPPAAPLSATMQPLTDAPRDPHDPRNPRDPRDPSFDVRDDTPLPPRPPRV